MHILSLSSFSQHFTPRQSSHFRYFLLSHYKSRCLFGLIEQLGAILIVLTIIIVSIDTRLESVKYHLLIVAAHRHDR